MSGHPLRGGIVLRNSILIGIVVIIVLFAAGWVALRIHRNGDFAFRIKKLQKRTSALISSVMELENESDYFALYENPHDQQLIREVESAMRKANEGAVDVSDHLQELLKRANSWFNFSDLYVEIGIQEENLERAEAMYEEATEKLKSLPKI